MKIFLRLYFICAVVLFSVITSARIDPKLRLCHEIECPENAVSCTKSFEASADNTKLITKFVCDGSGGAVLLSKVNEVANSDPARKIHQPYTITKKFLVI